MARVVRCCASYWSRRLRQLYSGKDTMFVANQKIYFHSTRWLFVEGVELKMPSLSPTMTEGKIIKWIKKEGDTIAPGDVLCEVETDKAVVAFETEEEGILAKILVPENTKDIKVGTLIALMVGEGEDWKSVEIPKSAGSTDASGGVTSEASSKGAASFTGASGTQVTKALGPAVKTLIEKYGIDKTHLQGTGPQGRILKGDVLSFIKVRNLTPQPARQVPLPGKKVPAVPKPPALSGPSVLKVGEKYVDLEITAARALPQGHKTSIPHEYLTVAATCNKLDALRKKWRDEDDFSASSDDFLIKACAVALQQCPQVNSVWRGNQCLPVNEIDLAVSVPTDVGLVMPIVRGVARKGVQEIANTMKELTQKANEGKLEPVDYTGGTFTLLNLGQYGVREFTSVIHPPQCAVLTVGSGTNTLDKDGVLLTQITATLCYDRRVIDEELAAEFLGKFKELIEDPVQILLGSFEKLKIGDLL